MNTGKKSTGSMVVDQRLVATQFQLSENVAAHYPAGVHIDRMTSPIYDGIKWAVRRRGYVLSTNGEWEYEPMPSSRDDDFYARYRFGSLDAALEALDLYMSKIKNNEETYI